MNATSPFQTVISGIDVSARPGSASPVGNLVIETLDEFAGGVYTTSTTADYINATLSSADYN